MNLRHHYHLGSARLGSSGRFLSLSVLSAQYNGLYTILCILNQSRLTTMLKSGPWMHISYTIINCIRMGRGGDGGLDRFAPDHQVTRDTRNRRISSRPNRVAQRSAVFNDVILYTSFRHRLSCVCAVMCCAHLAAAAASSQQYQTVQVSSSSSSSSYK